MIDGVPLAFVDRRRVAVAYARNLAQILVYPDPDFEFLDRLALRGVELKFNILALYPGDRDERAINKTLFLVDERARIPSDLKSFRSPQGQHRPTAQ